MAMNKKEVAYVEGLEERIRLLQAWRLTGPAPLRDLPPPKRFGELTFGWEMALHAITAPNYGDRPFAYKACSDSINHGTGWRATSTQGARSLYSTELRALQAVRAEYEEVVLKNLAKIDRRISDLLAGAPEKDE